MLTHLPQPSHFDSPATAVSHVLIHSLTVNRFNNYMWMFPTYLPVLLIVPGVQLTRRSAQSCIFIVDKSITFWRGKHLPRFEPTYLTYMWSIYYVMCLYTEGNAISI